MEELNLWITAHSGASENVVSEALLPTSLRYHPREAPKASAMRPTTEPRCQHRLEKAVRMPTDEGHPRLPNMQVTDSNTSLERVKDLRDGGSIMHLSFG